jgi:TorA-specific chaperone
MKNSKKSLSEDQRAALLESIRKLCRVFWGPTRESCDQMLKDTYLLSFVALDIESKSAPVNTLDQLSSIIGGFSDPDALFQYLEEGYVRLFINNRGGVAAPLYASCYEAEKPPRLMGEAAVRMQKKIVAAGMDIGDDIREPPDHLSIELEFLYFLLSQAKPGDRPDSMAQAAMFASQIMLPWVRIFNQRLKDETRCRFYPLITAVLLSVLQGSTGWHQSR